MYILHLFLSPKLQAVHRNQLHCLLVLHTLFIKLSYENTENNKLYRLCVSNLDTNLNNEKVYSHVTRNLIAINPKFSLNITELFVNSQRH